MSVATWRFWLVSMIKILTVDHFLKLFKLKVLQIAIASFAKTPVSSKETRQVVCEF